MCNWNRLCNIVSISRIIAKILDSINPYFHYVFNLSLISNRVIFRRINIQLFSPCSQRNQTSSFFVPEYPFLFFFSFLFFSFSFIFVTRNIPRWHQVAGTNRYRGKKISHDFSRFIVLLLFHASRPEVRYLSSMRTSVYSFQLANDSISRDK